MFNYFAYVLLINNWGNTSFCYIKFFLFVFLGPHSWHMEVPRLGVKSELYLLAYTTAIATLALNHVCDLHQSSRQCWILKPLNKAGDWTCILMDASQFCFCWALGGTPSNSNSHFLYLFNLLLQNVYVYTYAHTNTHTHTHTHSFLSWDTKNYNTPEHNFYSPKAYLECSYKKIQLSIQ